LHNELSENLVRSEKLLHLGQVAGYVSNLVANRIAQRLFHVVEVCAQVIHSEGMGEVSLFSPGEQLGHVPKVREPVIDGRSREQEKGLRPQAVVQQIVKSIIARGFACFTGAHSTRVAKVVRLIDHYDVRQFGDALEPLWKIAFPT
jgi:hypothetical protein